MWLEGVGGFLLDSLFGMFWFIAFNPKLRLGIWHEVDCAKIENLFNSIYGWVVCESP